MKDTIDTPRNIDDKTQYKILVFIALGVLSMVALLSLEDGYIFQRFLGQINPLFAFFIVTASGLLLLLILLSRGWFTIYKKKYLKELLPYFGLVILFVSVAILVDCKIVYPEDTHIFWPESLLFYPAIGFLVEIIFHILPLSAILLAFSFIFKNKNFKKITWTSIFIVALLEPTYQTFFMGIYPIWAIVAIWFNLFFFNLIQLITFKEYDFVSMFLLRLFYYLMWHIGWGYIRLDLFFP